MSRETDTYQPPPTRVVKSVRCDICGAEAAGPNHSVGRDTTAWEALPAFDETTVCRHHGQAERDGGGVTHVVRFDICPTSVWWSIEP